LQKVWPKGFPKGFPAKGFGKGFPGTFWEVWSKGFAKRFPAKGWTKTGWTKTFPETFGKRSGTRGLWWVVGKMLIVHLRYS